MTTVSSTIAIDVPQQKLEMKNFPSENSSNDDSSRWRIALYYVYVDLSRDKEVPAQVEFHRDLCEQLELKGRIRISAEGINGVLSGDYVGLQQYEHSVTQNLEKVSQHKIHLDVKYCSLRNDIPLESQLFDSLMVKKTATVISLFDTTDPVATKKRHRRNGKTKKTPQQQEEVLLESEHLDQSVVNLERIQQEMMQFNPSPHLTAAEWNAHLLQKGKSSTALLLDVRNVYESRVGRFTAPNVPTLLTNTRKYSDLPQLLATNPHIQEKEEIYMYCTGGVRCERVSMLVQSLYPEKRVYQLQGGIQTYLASQQQIRGDPAGEEAFSIMNLFQGKNFVFDPRRTDPMHGPVSMVGECLVCSTPHDDYDNGHAPSDEREARCNTCRMLILVCNTCRPSFACWGEQASEHRPLIYCGLDRCNHEGAAPIPELVSPSYKE